jgi:hypothetical protein
MGCKLPLSHLIHEARTALMEAKKESDIKRFMAVLRPNVRSLAQNTAREIQKDPAKAAAIAWLVLEDVNAHTAANLAETILSPLVPDGIPEGVQDMVFSISSQPGIGYGIVEAGVFGVALLEEVGEKSYAKRLAKALAKEFAEYTTNEASPAIGVVTLGSPGAKHSRPELPVSPDDWALYSDMKGVKQAAKALTAALKHSEAQARKKLVDLGDEGRAHEVLTDIYRALMIPVMGKYRNYGASDTEPNTIAKTYLDSIANRIGVYPNEW